MRRCCPVARSLASPRDKGKAKAEVEAAVESGEEEEAARGRVARTVLRRMQTAVCGGRHIEVGE